MPEFYRRYVDDTLTIMPSVNAASNFLQVLNAHHPSVSFTMEVEKDGMLLFVGIQLLNKSTSINTKAFVKPTNKGLLLHYDSRVVARYKHCLVRTMLERAYRLSSSWEFFYWIMHSTWKCFFPIFIIQKITSIGSLINLFWKRHLQHRQHWTWPQLTLRE